MAIEHQAKDEVERLSKRQTDKVLREAEWRWVPMQYWSERPGYEHYKEPQILYKGKWLDLARTDLLDDVRTGRFWKGDEDPIALYRESILFGARVTDEGFYVIDSGTDG